MMASFAVLTEENEVDDWFSPAMGSTELASLPGVLVGLSNDGNRVELQLNDDHDGSRIVFKNGPSISPVPRGGKTKKRNRSIGASDIIEIKVDLSDGPPRTIARVRTADAARIIGDVLA